MVHFILFCASNDEITSTEVEYFEHKAITEALQIEPTSMRTSRYPKEKRSPYIGRLLLMISLRM
nr:hypothetical protein [uncultured Porphyromonas sp.]